MRSTESIHGVTHLPPTMLAGSSFPEIISNIADAHRPSEKPLFQQLRQLTSGVAHDPGFLGELYVVYQAAMHATRAAVYFLPHLDTPALRIRKLQILIDDDGLPDGDTHHYQLTRVFRNIGASLPLTDDDFAGPEDLVPHLDPAAAHFVRLATTLYARTLGPWCIVETMSDNWMRALADALATHFPDVVNEPYFADCFAQGVEERHAQEAISVTMAVLQRRPHLLAETIDGAHTMANALDGVWRSMEQIVHATVIRHESACAIH